MSNTQGCFKCQQNLEKFFPATAAHKMACTYALIKADSECQSWLVRCKDAHGHGRPTREQLEQDVFLDFVKHKPWFQKFLEMYDEKQ